ncbi:MAG: hypothetical protein JXB62_05000 [Pirellulales bacterium]|nr:hypothetical protein [Pirellulales bacterium]
MRSILRRWPVFLPVIAIVFCSGLTMAWGQEQLSPYLMTDPGYANAVGLNQGATGMPAARANHRMVSSSFNADEPSLAERVADLESRLAAADKKAAAVKKKAAGKPSVSAGGRLFWDFGNFTQDANSFAQVGNAENGVEPRTARIFVKGTAFDVFDGVVEMAFEPSNGETSFKNVYFTVNELPLLGSVRVGHYKEPFSLEQLTSNRWMTFMERSVADVFTPARNVGVMAFDVSESERMTWAIGAFVDQMDDKPPLDHGDHTATAVTMRWTFLPWYDEATEGRGLLHTGISYSYRDAADSQVRFRQRPEAHLGPYVVNTDYMDAESYQLLAAEMAFVYGPFSVQSEYIGAYVDRIGAPNANFNGVYVYTSYFLTGEHRPYKRSGGVFDRLKPFENFFRVRDADGYVQTGKGAWELAYRYSYLDLNDAGILGGRVSDHTFGVNWYLTPYTRLMFNYVDSTLYDAGLEGNMDIFEMRAQMDF